MFCSGQTFTGTLVIDGSGTEMDPIIIDIYGGSDRAVINGENHLCCIYLDNKQGIEIHNLELINDGGTNPNVNATQKRLGIYATAYWGIKKHLVFKNLYIHSIYPNNYQSSSEQILYAGTGIEITGFGGNTSSIDHILIDEVLENFKKKKKFSSEIFDELFQQKIMNTIKSIEIFKGNLENSDIAFLEKN